MTVAHSQYTALRQSPWIAYIPEDPADSTAMMNGNITCIRPAAWIASKALEPS